MLSLELTINQYISTFIITNTFAIVITAADVAVIMIADAIIIIVIINEKPLQ